MKLPNLLASRRGRLTAFFALYVTEGIPLGFAATAIATQMRREGLGPAEIGAFVGSLYLPWAFKWVLGPFVDVLSSERWGRRRMWIVIAQVMMIATLMAALPINFTTEIKLFTLIIILHNIFGATQDVAIDALAVNTLHEDERGLANGLMFSGAYLGQAIGGAGVLFLVPIIGFKGAFFFVAGCIAAVTLFVALPLQERRGPPRPAGSPTGLKVATREIGGFIRDAWRAFIGTRSAFVALIFALVPVGAHALGLALQSNLAVELGLDDPAIARLNLWSTVISAVCCVVGGWLSDRFGRRRMLALYIAGTALPTLYLAWTMQQHGWIMAIDMQADRPIPPVALVNVFWACTLSYSVFQGLKYGTTTALFMDVTTPAVAATQFTAYMALTNLVIAYSATWQGMAIERVGYPSTLVIDAAFGLVCLALLPMMSPVRAAGARLPGPEALPEAVAP